MFDIEAVNGVVEVPSNYSDNELCKLIRETYPGLKGPLLTLLVRVESVVDGGAYQFIKDTDCGVKNGDTFKCPHCSSEIRILI